MSHNNTPIKYNGVVQIDINSKRIMSHNNGSDKFFNLLNRFISRHTVTVGELPGYLMMYQMSSQDVLSNTDAESALYTSVELFSSKLPAVANLTSVGGKEVVLYTTPLSNSSLKSGITVSNNTGVCLALISADATTILAAADIVGGGALIKSLQQGMNATVKWQLSFENS